MSPELTHEQELFFQIMFCWLPIIMTVVVNVCFLLDFFKVVSIPQEIFLSGGPLVFLMVGPTIMVLVVGYLIYGTIKFKRHKDRIEERHKGTNGINFFDFEN